MKIKIAGQDRELTFNIGFVRKLDKIYYMSQSGVEFGAGLTLAIPQLSLRNPSALSDVIRCAVGIQVSQQQADEAVEEYAQENDGLVTLFEIVEEGLKSSPVTKETYKRMKDTAEEAEKESLTND